MDWKRFFDSLGLNGTRWQWKIMRWERNLKAMLKGEAVQSEFSLSSALIYINITLFIIMLIMGMLAGLGLRPLLSPDGYLLIHAGGQYWPLVLAEGQWWRCLTYAFTHSGLIHIGFNMVVLKQVGPLLEFEIGRPPFLILYTLTALTATIAGYFWHPLTPVVGASGSLFGLIGFAIVYYHRMGPGAHHVRNFMLQWALYAGIFGVLSALGVMGGFRVDNAAHLGGALGGAVLGLVMPLGIRGRKRVAGLTNILAALCLGALVLSFILLAFSWINGSPH